METDELNPKELRIGNLIESTVMKGVYCEVVVITADRVNGSNQKYYKPILLTEEWLSKLGFINPDNSMLYCFESGNFSIELYANMTLITVYDNDRDIALELELPYYFVHQLQNLYFALTGRELELVNSEKKY